MRFQIHRPMQLFRQFSLIICLWFGGGQLFAGESPEIREYQIKATFLMRFGNYITYPEVTLNNSASVFNICVLGDDPFQGILDTLVKDEKIQGRLVKTTYLRDVEKADDCQTLFISSSEQKQLSNVLAYLIQRPILTVSDMENFVIRGGMIQFYLLDNKVRFFIDPITASGAKLTVSSRLLQVAKVIKRDGRKNK